LEDEGGSLVVVRTNLALAVLWVFDVLLLVIAMALSAIRDGSSRPIESTDEIITGNSDEEP
jgi:hypothetical protein